MKKLIALSLSFIMMLGLMAPAFATETGVPAGTATGTTAEALATEEALPSELTTEQLLMTVTILMRVREALNVEAQLDGIIKAVGELKKDEKTIQLSSKDFLAICFYSIERSAVVAPDSATGTVTCSWDYKNAAGNSLRISMNTDTIGWVLHVTTGTGKTTVTRTVSVK